MSISSFRMDSKSMKPWSPLKIQWRKSSSSSISKHSGRKSGISFRDSKAGGRLASSTHRIINPSRPGISYSARNGSQGSSGVWSTLSPRITVNASSNPYSSSPNMPPLIAIKSNMSERSASTKILDSISKKSIRITKLCFKRQQIRI